MPESGHADRVLALRLDWLKECHRGVLLRAWKQSESQRCSVYRGIHTEYEPRLLGLRRALEPVAAAKRIADEIVHREIGEAQGSLNDDLELSDGDYWFRGNRRGWRPLPVAPTATVHNASTDPPNWPSWPVCKTHSRVGKCGRE